MQCNKTVLVSGNTILWIFRVYIEMAVGKRHHNVVKTRIVIRNANDVGNPRRVDRLKEIFRATVAAIIVVTGSAVAYRSGNRAWW